MNYLPGGTVYGVLLNFNAEREALEPRMHEAPYQAPPRAPILYVKTANTWSPSGCSIPIPLGTDEVEIGATIGMVMGEAGAIDGYVLLNDLSLPHDSFYRPPVRAKCRDGFLGIGPALRTGGDPSDFKLEVRINGELRHSADFSQLYRPATRLLADVSEFMTLQPGDVLMLGCNAGRPLAKAGDRIEISASGFDTLQSKLVREVA